MFSVNIEYLKYSMLLRPSDFFMYLMTINFVKNLTDTDINLCKLLYMLETFYAMNHIDVY